MLLKSVAAVAALVSLVAAIPTQAPVSATPRTRSRRNLSERYIVSLKSDSDWTAHRSFVTGVHTSLLKRSGNSYEGLVREYQSTAFRGYSGHFDGESLAEIKARHDVDYIERQQHYFPSNVARQPDVPSFGLAQISNKNASGSTYYFDATAGFGSTIYVLDTGINLAHEDFEGRARHGYTVDKKSGDADEEGHGTHVAGTAAGLTYGVAKAANLVAVKLSVDGEEGFATSNCLDAIEWAVKDIVKNKVKNAVINLSIGGAYSAALNAIVNAAVLAGINVVVAAGNENTSTEMLSPASARLAITVGAVNKNLTMADYSNWGAEVDILAPGTDIWSASNTDSTGEVKMSGTSMATPHIAGLVAYLRVLEGLDAGQATDRLLQLSQHRRVSGVPPGTVNLLAYNGAGEAYSEQTKTDAAREAANPDAEGTPVAKEDDAGTSVDAGEL